MKTHFHPFERPRKLPFLTNFTPPRCFPSPVEPNKTNVVYVVVMDRLGIMINPL